MPKKILLADDSITIQKVIGLTFANEDVVLTVVDNGDEAITKAKETIPDLIIADVVMPGKDGYEVCYSAKNDPALAHVPVLLLTGTFETFDETMATKVGADGFITKPFESQALIDKVNELIGTAEQRRAGASGLSAGDYADAPVNPNGAAGIEQGDEFLDTFEPLDSFEPVDDIAPLDEIAPMDDFAALDEVAPVEDLAPMELDEFSTDEPALSEPEPVEEDPMAGFGHLTPDAEETSFADVTLEEAAAEEAVSHDDLLPAPEPAEMPEETIAAVPETAPGDGTIDGGWNLAAFNDYMAEKAPAAEAHTPPPAADVAPAEVEQPAAFDELPSSEEPPVEAAAEFQTEPDSLDLGSENFGATADEFQTTPAFGTSDEDLPSSIDEVPQEAPALIELSTPLEDSMAAEEPAPLDEFAPVAADLETAPKAALTSIDLSPDDGDMELMPVAPDAEMPLQQVADLYSLDDNAPGIELSPESAAEEFATEPAMTDELPDEPVAESFNAAIEEPAIAEPALAEAPVTQEAPAPVAPQAAPVTQAFDTSALEQQLGRIPDLIEGRVKSMLENDALVSSLGEKTGKLVEAKIEEAIRKVAPDIIEQLVKRAIADATERILNETIGRLRNG